MIEYWLDEEEGLKLISKLVGKKVTTVNIDKTKFGPEVIIEFERGIILDLVMVGYPEEWELKIKIKHFKEAEL